MANEDSEYVIGIDLGTTNTCVAVVVDGEVHVIPDEEGETLQASLVAFLEDGSVVVGNGARKEAVTDPVNTISSAKRLIGQAWGNSTIKQARQHLPYKIAKGPNQAPLLDVRGRKFAVPEISGMVLRRAKDIASRYLGQSVTKAVITVPANFNDTQRQMTRLAGELAGLEVLRIINEPTAAALAYGYGRDVRARLVIYDFGGGTFDITLLDVRHNVFEVLSTAGDSYLGGDDFDTRLAQYMLRGFEKQYGFKIDHDPVVRGRLKQVGEKIKRQLSNKERAIVNVRDLAVAPDGRHCDLRFQVDRAGVHKRFADIVQRTFLVCDEALANAHVSAADVQGVVLVGGSTRMPLVREMVEQYFTQPPLTDINPDEVVAVGAAIQGAALVADPFSPAGAHQPLLLDVTPRSLGVEVVGGFYDVLIDRNTAVPCEQTRVFATSQDGQTTVRLQIFQGESRVASDNVKLGEIELYNLRPMPRGMVEIEVTFAIDADGIVDVTAKDRETGIAQQTRVMVTAGFSDEAVRVMRRRNQ